MVNKSELIDMVSEKSGLTKKDSERAINAVFDSIEEALSGGNKVSLVGFGTFEVRTRGEREGRNPRTGAPITIPARSVPAFKPGKTLKDSVNE